ncbi:MAG TPA: hypothetical protein VMU84_16275 [Thermoanaerobaculia bacterium]|nr:hypothetical protein [Thermoanaerobaculia bacterium]
MMIFPLALWGRCGGAAHRLLKNDPAFGFFTPLVFPLAMGVLAKTAATGWPALSDRQQPALIGVFVVFALLATLLIHADMKIGPLEPYMLRSDDALVHEAEVRGKLRTLYREIHTGDLPADQRKIATDEIGGLQRAAHERSRELAAGFGSWRDLRKRGAGVAFAQVFVNCIVATGCAALFAWLLIAAYRALIATTPEKLTDALRNEAIAIAAANDANMLCVGLLMLWFPLRLYSEWYTGFYTFRGLREYVTFWFLSVVAVVGVLLIAIILKPGALGLGMTAFGTTVMIVFGLFAKLKPELVGYAAVVFEEMPLVPYLLTLILGLFAVMLAIVVAVTT